MFAMALANFMKALQTPLQLLGRSGVPRVVMIYKLLSYLRTEQQTQHHQNVFFQTIYNYGSRMPKHGATQLTEKYFKHLPPSYQHFLPPLQRRFLPRAIQERAGALSSVALVESHWCPNSWPLTLSFVQ